jgi:hypothetical protein
VSVRRAILQASLPALLAAVLSASAAAGPPVTAGTGGSTPLPTDRAAKLDLIERLRQGPQILILGDSRGRVAGPGFIQRLTGHTAFNAAVTGGSVPDAWVFTRYTADRFPHQRRRYIWFVSAGLATNIVDPLVETDPRSRRYLAEVAPYLSPVTISAPLPMDTRYGPDGAIADWNPSYTPKRTAKLAADAARLIAVIRAQPPVATPLDPSRFRLFEHLLAYMNRLGARPVIVLNPIYPTVLAEVQKHGNPIAASSLAYLQSLRGRYDFVVVDGEDSRKWGGTAYDWTNITHVDPANMRRLLRYVVAHSDGALR